MDHMVYFFLHLDPFYIEKLVLSIAGGAIGAGGALLVYYLKVSYDKRSEELKRKRLLHNKLSYFNSLLNSIINATETQITLNRKYAKESKEKPFDLIYFNLSINEDLRRICEVMDQELIYQSYLEFLNKSNSGKEILQALNDCDYIYEASRLIKEKIKVVNLKTEETSLEYSKLSEKIMDEAGTEMNEIKKRTSEYEKDPFWIFINNSFNNYYSKITEDQTIPLREEHFIRPFKIGLVHNFEKQNIADRLSTMCKECTHKFTYLIRLSNDLSEEIENQTNEIEKALPYLKEIKSKIINTL